MEPQESLLTAAERQVYDRIAQAGPRRGAGISSTPDYSLTLSSVGLRAPESQSVLARRASRRDVTRQLDLELFATFVRWSFGRTPSGRRPYPTSGGLKTLRFLVVANNIAELPPNLYWITDGSTVHRVDNSLRFNRHYTSKVAASLGLAEGSVPACIIIIVADWRCIATRYENCTLLSGYWDAGAALQTMCTIATELELPGTPSAALAPQELADLLGVSHWELGQVGAFATGGR